MLASISSSVSVAVRVPSCTAGRVLAHVHMPTRVFTVTCSQPNFAEEREEVDVDVGIDVDVEADADVHQGVEEELGRGRSRGRSRGRGVEV